MPDPRDPVTGEQYSPGPIRLAEHQKRIIDEALSKKENGDLKYSLVIYSAPKKSGKSALTSAVALYMAYHNANSFIACLANDGKQSADRLYAPIHTCCRLHRQLGGVLSDVSPYKTEVTLNNFTKIEAVPCDAAGEAGSQPLLSCFSELWAYTSEQKKRLFTEFIVPPTLYGKAMRWIETYAGFYGESEILENIYHAGFLEGTPHPDFLDLQGRDGPVVRINKKAGIFTYWDTEPRMVWQVPEFYEEQRIKLDPFEYARVHENRWQSPMSAFIQKEWWDACIDPDLPSLKEGSKISAVVGIDMAVTGDCAALVLVTKHPVDPDTKIAIRGVRIFNPKRLGGKIDQEEVIRPVIEQWFKNYNIVCWTYDPREMSKLAQDMEREGYGWFHKFGQTTQRAISDKRLHDFIMARQIAWNPETTFGDVGYVGQTVGDTLYTHMTKAGAEVRSGGLRLEKLNNQDKIDGAVALSQATLKAHSLVLDSAESELENLIIKLNKGQITIQEFTEMSGTIDPSVKERYIHGR